MNTPIRFAVCGLSGRGFGMMKDVLVPRENVRIVAVCDVYQDRIDRAVDYLKESGFEAAGYTDYHKLFEEVHPDAVYIATSWQTHFQIAIAALKAGVAVACEVGAGFSIDECWQLVHTQEETGTPCMLMENCCYGRNEMMLKNMITKGAFGTIIHMRGGYQHDLREEVSYGFINRHYRIDNYMRRNCDNYPTHELGPIAQMLGINRGNAMLSLVSMGTKSCGLHEYIQRHPDVTECLHDYSFKQSDIVTTMIRCANGETIILTLDTTLPRPYSRGLRIQGTKGIYQEDNNAFFEEDPESNRPTYETSWPDLTNNFENYREKYEHPVWKEFLSDIKGGHGGMDWLEFDDFLDALENNRPMPIDVYDMALWLSISVLSEQSIAMGSIPVPIPDFTNGKWLTRR